jgi:two-component system, NarL family, nitrate/nitrite response regulator NarL
MTQRFPQTKVVLLTDQVTSEWLDKAVQAGASGFLPKDISADALRFSLELVLLGEQIFPTLHSLLEPRFHAVPAVRPSAPDNHVRPIPISVRENQILGCLVNGLPNKTIARHLDIAEATVKVHLKALLRKINVRNRTQAAIWGLSNAPRDPLEQRVSEVHDQSTAIVLNGAE